MTWHESLRNLYRPEEIRVVFVGESPPDSGAHEKRFFYSSTLFRADNLFRGLMLAIYDAGPKHLTGSKPEWLVRFKSDGFWLVDLIDRPVNRLSPRDRRRAQLDAVPSAVARIRDARATTGVVVCHAPTFNVLARSLEHGVGGLLHDAPIPFPLGNHRARFVELARRSICATGIDLPLP